MDHWIRYDGRVFERLVDECRPRWHCLRTGPRQDRVLAHQLTQDGLRVFAPVAPKAVLHGQTWADVEVPVLPDLVFVFTTPSVASAIAADRRVREEVPLQRPVATSADDMTLTRARELLGLRDERTDPEADDDAFSRHDMPSSGSWAHL